MKAYTTTVTVLIDPRKLGPDASSEHIYPASMYDFMSGLLSENEYILDWDYIGDEHLRLVDIDPDSYEEGEFYELPK